MTRTQWRDEQSEHGMTFRVHHNGRVVVFGHDLNRPDLWTASEWRGHPMAGGQFLRRLCLRVVREDMEQSLRDWATQQV